MTADMWIQLGFLTMAFLGGELGGVILMGYILAWRDNRKGNAQKNHLHAGSVKGNLNFNPKQKIVVFKEDYK